MLGCSISLWIPEVRALGCRIWLKIEVVRLQIGDAHLRIASTREVQKGTF